MIISDNVSQDPVGIQSGIPRVCGQKEIVQSWICHLGGYLMTDVKKVAFLFGAGFPIPDTSIMGYTLDAGLYRS